MAEITLVPNNNNKQKWNKQPIIPGLNLSLQIILYLGSTNENLYPPKAASDASHPANRYPTLMRGKNPETALYSHVSRLLYQSNIDLQARYPIADTRETDFFLLEGS